MGTKRLLSDICREGKFKIQSWLDLFEATKFCKTKDIVPCNLAVLNFDFQFIMDNIIPTLPAGSTMTNVGSGQSTSRQYARIPIVWAYN